MKTDTADQHWNVQWAEIAEGSKWLTPEEDVVAWAKTLKPGARILDLGAGVGRHALLLAKAGFQVTALDAAPEGLEKITQVDDSVHTTLGRMDELPFEDGAFDHVLSWNVIYHGDEEILTRTISEIRRVMVKGGTFMGTMLSKRRLPVEQSKADGNEISNNTWVFEADRDSDKVHPHYYCNAAELLALFDGFEVLSLKDQVHEKPGSWHWHLVTERMA